MKLNNNLKSLLQHISCVFDMQYNSNDDVKIKNYTSVLTDLESTSITCGGVTIYYENAKNIINPSHYGNTRMLYSYQISRENMESLYEHIKICHVKPESIIGMRGIGYGLGCDGKFYLKFSTYRKIENVLRATIFAELHITPPDHRQKIFNHNYKFSNTYYWYTL